MKSFRPDGMARKPQKGRESTAHDLQDIGISPSISKHCADLWTGIGPCEAGVEVIRDRPAKGLQFALTGFAADERLSTLAGRVKG
jgi:hypothetical protein